MAKNRDIVILGIITGLDFRPVRLIEAVVHEVDSAVAEEEPDGLTQSLDGEVGQLVGRHIFFFSGKILLFSIEALSIVVKIYTDLRLYHS